MGTSPWKVHHSSHPYPQEILVVLAGRELVSRSTMEPYLSLWQRKLGWRRIDVLGYMTVVAPALRAKLENARRDDYPIAFPLQHMKKDFRLIAGVAEECAVPIPATAVASQMFTAELARGAEEDFSAVIRLTEDLAGTRGRGQ
jgi:hypothetical protein